MSATRVYLVDDQALVRDGLAALLEQDSRFEVVGTCGDPRQAIEEVGRLSPDVVLLDVAMPGLSGLDLVKPVLRAAPEARILFASNHEGSQVVRQALAAGGHGYLSKGSTSEELAAAILAVRAGETYVSQKLAMENGEPISTLTRLTPREREVFQLLAIGKPNKEVASTLDLSLGTVKKHRENLQRKLECRSGAELARLAIREGLLTP